MVLPDAGRGARLHALRRAQHGKGFWIGELQAGQGVTGMRIADPVDSHDEEFWMWKVLSHGAREIAVYAWYPMNSGFESNGYGLINLDGTLTPRARAAGKVAQEIARNGGDLLATEPARAQVAVLFNRLSYMVGGSEPSLSKLGNATARFARRRAPRVLRAANSRGLRPSHGRGAR